VGRERKGTRVRKADEERLEIIVMVFMGVMVVGWCFLGRGCGCSCVV
jgi:hypothetical protein